MSERTEQLRDSVMGTAPAICPERALLLTAAYRETEGQPLIIRRALAFARILEGMSIYLQPRELIVGNLARRPRAAPLFPEYASSWLERELDELPSRPTDRFQVSEEDKRPLLEALPYWRGKTHLDTVRSLIRQALPDELLPFFTFENSTLNQSLFQQLPIVREEGCAKFGVPGEDGGGCNAMMLSGESPASPFVEPLEELGAVGVVGDVETAMGVDVELRELQAELGKGIEHQGR